ncbi:MAG TPA: bifunctional UDP-N-acetylglucosamine diphosphorylase/glucosamine-1-phosphate N-acetyltransferase GlmU [Thermopetrobacter sp.]|nr:bifunctional UDP-N-acetylglucosamine diphosphorylase/glucosamine-1-phosphate N-acetyltransferase GlmU [Thermopetrobacter sp.]
MTPTAIIVLAAGRGTRMRSGLPKVLHRVAGRSMLGHVLSAAGELEPRRAVVVTGPDMPAVEREARRFMPVAQFAVQPQQKGTAHAAGFARDELAGFEGVTLVLYGDVPLVRAGTLQRLAREVSADAPLVILAFEADDPKGYGRLILDAGGPVRAIREEKDACDEEKRITLCNSGIIAIDNALLWELLPEIGNANAQGEYYLTDIVELAAQAGREVRHVRCDEPEVLGVNDRAQLAVAERLMQRRLRARALANGVTLIDPDSVFLSADTEIAPDVLIEPWVFIGPGVSIAEGAVIRAHSHLEEASVGPRAQVGPFARLRPGAEIRETAKVGNFVEVKKAVIEEGAKVNHFTYIGDARVGAGANIGAGTITCNYDGANKHFTDIGKGAFIGSNSALVAPVRIGEGAYVGSGSVITKDVAPGALAVARGRQVEKPGWAARRKAKAGTQD